MGGGHCRQRPVAWPVERHDVHHGDPVPGEGTTPISAHWNGKKWSAVALPKHHGEMTSVSTTSARSVWADDTGTPLHWNGTRRKATRIPASPPLVALVAVAATSAKDAVAVGYNPVPKMTSYILQFNGRKWSHVASPNPLGDSGLSWVSAYGKTTWAVGGAIVANSESTKPVIMSSIDGRNWRIDHVPIAYGDFNAASAGSASTVYAVGTCQHTRTDNAFAAKTCFAA
jgi:hypothetical protein